LSPSSIEAAVLGAIESSPPPEITERTIDDPIAEMRGRFSLGDYTGALEMAELLLAEEPGNLEAAECGENCRTVLEGMYAARLGPLMGAAVVVPRCKCAGCRSITARCPVANRRSPSIEMILTSACPGSTRCEYPRARQQGRVLGRGRVGRVRGAGARARVCWSCFDLRYPGLAPRPPPARRLLRRGGHLLICRRGGSRGARLPPSTPPQDRGSPRQLPHATGSPRAPGCGYTKLPRPGRSTRSPMGTFGRLPILFLATCRAGVLIR
jgi:hypothetical protein